MNRMLKADMLQICLVSLPYSSTLMTCSLALKNNASGPTSLPNLIACGLRGGRQILIPQYIPRPAAQPGRQMHQETCLLKTIYCQETYFKQK